MLRRSLLTIPLLAAPIHRALAVHASEAEQLMKASFEAGQPGGAFLLQQGDRTLYRAAFGVSDLSVGTPLQPADLLRIGSITKLFTALAVLQLAKTGHVKLEDSIERYLRDFNDGGTPVTVLQLLGHTAGLGNYTELPAFRERAETGVTPAELLAMCAGTPRQAAPGAKYLYSNTGYALLGAMVERISGLSFADYVARYIATPLNLADTAMEGHERSTKRLIAGHGRRRADGTRTRVPQVHTSLRGASGGLVSTVDDLARFAIKASSLMDAARWTEMQRPVLLNDGSSAPQAIGWQRRPFLGRERLEHGGATPGFVGHLLWLPSQGVVAVALLNESAGRQPGPGFLTEQLASVALGERVEQLQTITMDVARLGLLVGRYGTEQPDWEIGIYEGQLMVRRGESRALLEAITQWHFVDRRRTVVHYHFERNDQNQVTALRVMREDRPTEILKRR